MALLSSVAFGASTTPSSSTSTTSQKSLLESLRASKFDLLLLSDNALQKNSSDDYAINGLSSETLIYMGINTSKSDNFRADTSVAIRDTDNARTTKSWTGFGVRYKKSGLLKEADHGINLSVELRNQMYDKDTRDALSWHGYISPRVHMSKGITSNFNLSSTLQHRQYYRTSGSDLVRRTSTRFSLAPSVGITEKLSVGTYMLFAHNIRGADVQTAKGMRYKNTTYVEIVPSIAYQITPRFSAEFYFDAVPFQSNDQATWAEDWEKQASIGMTLVYSMF